MIKADMKQVTGPVIWFHCASLGEFEQGRPIIDSIKSNLPEYKILLTFYSPSGYEIRKHYHNADFVYYLPWDTASAMGDLYQIVTPKMLIIIKYEFWYHLIRCGGDLQIPVIVCSALFRENQVFFKPWGGFFRGILKHLSHIYVQDQQSATLLANIGIKSVTVAGDTRIDRVATIIQNPESNPIVEHFLQNNKAFIIGSSWAQDISVLAPFINQHQEFKFIIAPHETSESQLNHLYAQIKRTMVRYTEYVQDISADILIIDTIGLLSNIYQYGKFAYIGGAFGKGLHNILEPAAFGLPLFFGKKNYAKFSEAVTLVELGGAFAINNTQELENAFIKVSNDENSYSQASESCHTYVHRNRGATELLLNHIKEKLD